jgi:hypothetical protein
MTTYLPENTPAPIPSNECVECGCDTRRSGFVNRVPYLSDEHDAYICGGCEAVIQEEFDRLAEESGFHDE